MALIAAGRRRRGGSTPKGSRDAETASTEISTSSSRRGTSKPADVAVIDGSGGRGLRGHGLYRGAMGAGEAKVHSPVLEQPDTATTAGNAGGGSSTPLILDRGVSRTNWRRQRWRARRQTTPAVS